MSPSMQSKDSAAEQLPVGKLTDELLGHPLALALGSLALSAFISHALFGRVDWRPILICTTSDILTIGLDHYHDHAALHALAAKSPAAPYNAAVLRVFTRARTLLVTAAALLVAALAAAPARTWALTALFVTPALLWDTPLFRFRRAPREKTDAARTAGGDGAFVIKRIPGMKALIIGVIRGCGTFMVVRSVLGAHGYALRAPWSPAQFVIWSTVNRACHAVMADIRDYPSDLAHGVPTLPVLLRSVLRTKILLTALHLGTMLAFARNAYIVLGAAYAVALVWALDERSARAWFRASFHSQTAVALVWAARCAVEEYRRGAW
ncbi:hypothetical protein WOLCODRAFT_143772 [Wolfiporia cocos MD-104 SS10]|uniref:UbiA prenyltransferase n=1 Tax=Wolfiporia cocos (strain MD-104) TaxID=742152 RepID=A0A2H3JJY6_WOLCO|nr:hypothetical protein WOLCODRAFT_143772 [Wolfiporia cocos MD-104 SS10]